MTSYLVNGGAFLHVPKTGGTWVFKVLSEAGIVQGNVNDEHHTGKGTATWAFTVLRDPVEWWISLWRHQMRSNWEDYSVHHPLADINGHVEKNIGKWLDKAATDWAGMCGRIYEQYTRNAVFLLRTENLAVELQTLGRRVGWPELNISMPRQNVSTHPVGRVGMTFGALRKAEHEAYKLWQSAGLEPDGTFYI